jgi:hypothetical protein
LNPQGGTRIALAFWPCVFRLHRKGDAGMLRRVAMSLGTRSFFFATFHPTTPWARDDGHVIQMSKNKISVQSSGSPVHHPGPDISRGREGSRPTMGIHRVRCRWSACVFVFPCPLTWHTHKFFAHYCRRLACFGGWVLCCSSVLRNVWSRAVAATL